MNAAATAPLDYAARSYGRPANDNKPPEAIIDLFAGGGGASEGIYQLTGWHPDIAVNHDAEAIGMHEVNHPSTRHYQEDIRKVDIAEVCSHLGGRRVGLLWASPDCKDHSKAKGGVPKDKNNRSLAWEVMRWIAGIRRATGQAPRVFALENVEEWLDWGPLHKYGKRAGMVQKKRRGKLFRMFVQQLRWLGATEVRWGFIIAANHGAPTTRKRLFLMARFDGVAIEWPEPTHAKQGRQGNLFDRPLLVWRSAAEIIDWNVPIPSIFGRARALKEKTMARIAKGIERYVINAKPRPFIVPVTHTKNGATAHDGHDPMRTATTAKGGEMAVSSPMIAPLTHRGGEGRVYGPGDTPPTVTAAPRGELGLMSATLTPRYGERPGQEPRSRSIEQPYPAVVPDGNGGQLTTAYLGRQFGSTVSGRSMEEPAPTAMTDGAGGKSQVVTAHLSSVAYGDDRPRAGTRAKSVEEPIGAVTGSNDKTVVAAHLTRHYGKSAAGDVEQPLGTPTERAKEAVSVAYMAQANGERVGRAAGEPVTTLTQRSTQQQIIAAAIDKYYGSGVPQQADRPLDAATSKARFGLNAAFLEQANTGMVGHSALDPVSTIVGMGSTQRLIDARLEDMGVPTGSRRRAVLEFLWTHFGDPTAEEWEDPLATARGRLRFGLVVIDDVVWQIVDIGMRMLTPRELFRAQGFPDSYVIEVTADGRKLTKTAQTRMAGNSVCPPVVVALLRVNLPEPMIYRRAA